MKPHHLLLLVSFAVASIHLQAQAPAAVAAVTAERIKHADRMLASEELLGRGTGEDGEEKEIKYVEDSLATPGLGAAVDIGTWYQDVPLVRLDREADASLSLKI